MQELLCCRDLKMENIMLNEKQKSIKLIGECFVGKMTYLSFLYCVIVSIVCPFFVRIGLIQSGLDRLVWIDLSWR